MDEIHEMREPRHRDHFGHAEPDEAGQGVAAADPCSDLAAGRDGAFSVDLKFPTLAGQPNPACERSKSKNPQVLSSS